MICSEAWVLFLWLLQDSDVERDSEPDYAMNSDSAASDYGGEKKKKKKHKEKKEKKTKKKKKEDEDSTHEETTKVILLQYLCLFLLCLWSCVLFPIHCADTGCVLLLILLCIQIKHHQLIIKCKAELVYLT